MLEVDNEIEYRIGLKKQQFVVVYILIDPETFLVDGMHCKSLCDRNWY